MFTLLSACSNIFQGGSEGHASRVNRWCASTAMIACGDSGIGRDLDVNHVTSTAVHPCWTFARQGLHHCGLRWDAPAATDILPPVCRRVCFDIMHRSLRPRFIGCARTSVCVRSGLGHTRLFTQFSHSWKGKNMRESLRYVFDVDLGNMSYLCRGALWQRSLL